MYITFSRESQPVVRLAHLALLNAEQREILLRQARALHLAADVNMTRGAGCNDTLATIDALASRHAHFISEDRDARVAFLQPGLDDDLIVETHRRTVAAIGFG